VSKFVKTSVVGGVLYEVGFAGFNYYYCFYQVKTSTKIIHNFTVTQYKNLNYQPFPMTIH
jgi:hypothetical protein